MNDFNEAVLITMRLDVAAKLKVSPYSVQLRVSSGSVVLTIVITGSGVDGQSLAAQLGSIAQTPGFKIGGKEVIGLMPTSGVLSQTMGIGTPGSQTETQDTDRIGTKKTVLELVKTTPSLSTLARVLTLDGQKAVVASLSNGSFTLLAPTNSAFEVLARLRNKNISMTMYDFLTAPSNAVLLVRAI